MPPGDPVICPLCERPIPPAQRDAHHLVPKCKGGRHTEFLHRVCHRQIHALLTETELARQYATVDALLAHPTATGVFDDPEGGADAERSPSAG